MALCLTRRPGQKLILDRPHIEITVESVVGKTVRLVIDAPKHVRIVRDELIYRAPAKAENPIPEGAETCSVSEQSN